MIEFTLKNGTIKEFRDKYNNEHIDSKNNIELSNIQNLGRYEIYSVNKNNKKIQIGDILEGGIVSDFFIVNNEIYINFANVLKNNNGIKLKKNCVRL